MLKAALYSGSGSQLKTSAAALVLLLVLGGAAYWLHANDMLNSLWPGASLAQVQPSPAAGTQGKRPAASVEVATAKDEA